MRHHPAKPRSSQTPGDRPQEGFLSLNFYPFSEKFKSLGSFTNFFPLPFLFEVCRTTWRSQFLQHFGVQTPQGSNFLGHAIGSREHGPLWKPCIQSAAYQSSVSGTDQEHNRAPFAALRNCIPHWLTQWIYCYPSFFPGSSLKSFLSCCKMSFRLDSWREREKVES